MDDKGAAPTETQDSNAKRADRDGRATLGEQPTRTGERRTTRIAERPSSNVSRRSRKTPQRSEADLARDSFIDRFLQQEPHLPIYDHSSAEMQLPQVTQDANQHDVDNDTAAAEAFKAQLMADIQNNRRRRPRASAAKEKGEKLSHGPKLGGSRAQRQRMKALQNSEKSK